MAVINGTDGAEVLTGGPGGDILVGSTTTCGGRSNFGSLGGSG